ncbi:peptide chain release factor N(5)-glutamine methyltransferase [Moraxella sp. VT-16-12]|uniref:peptide chain release factor N(5)-glutamine methyltransferase n=1 Tax=Moraxella sp. VT-16-12 TaxID=2014877 RepID=UPI000B7DA193|nr:peptide chain release factor N(5)-glutamine methyltransferase [Moraxella sp. VT-16-12]TWV81567.1 peptide chain release factor N(5)-glutamine methyltransferase [Moraxella sp. VT-16-12]
MMTVQALKSHFRQISHDTLPYHWLESWLLFVLKKDKSFLITDGDYVLSDDEYDGLTAGIKKMQQGVPLAYLMGKQGFFGHEFLVNEHTLIPRPDTEILLDVVLDFTDHHTPKNSHLLDLGTGSGCIALSLAKALPDWSVLAVDFSQSAIHIAGQNCELLQANNCQFVVSDWYKNVQSKFDVIVSNPPYIAKDDEHLGRLSAEPITALVADDDGLSDIKIIIAGAKNHLNKGGLLAIEHGFDQGEKVRLLFDDAGFVNVKTVKDYGGNDRVTFGVCDE